MRSIIRTLRGVVAPFAGAGLVLCAIALAVSLATETTCVWLRGSQVNLPGLLLMLMSVLLLVRAKELGGCRLPRGKRLSETSVRVFGLLLCSAGAMLAIYGV